MSEVATHTPVEVVQEISNTPEAPQEAPQGEREKNYLRELWELFNVAGRERLTPEERDWIREPEVPDPNTPKNEPGEQLFEMSSVVLKRQKDGQLRLGSKRNTMPPYPFEVFHTAAVFTDKDKDGEYEVWFPVAEEDLVQEFINRIRDSEGPVDVSAQLDILLELSGGSITDAAAIGMIASRIVARNLDKKGYHVVIDKDTQEKWHKNLPIFGDPNKENDVLGDNYYFWTAVYTATSLPGENPLIRWLDDHNAKIMTLSRQFFARQPTKTDHKDAFLLGKRAAKTFIALMRKSQERQEEEIFTIPLDYLESLPDSARVAVLANKLEQMGAGEELIIPDPDGSIRKSVYRFDTLEYFSAFPVVSSLYQRRPKDWRQILSEVRFREPSVSFVIGSGELILRKRQSELSQGLDVDKIDVSWIKDRVAEIETPEGKRLLRQLIAIGTSSIDSTRITIDSEEVFKYEVRNTLLALIRYPEIRKEYFSDKEWETVQDVISVCVDRSQGSLEEPPIVFRRTREVLPRAALVLPTDGIVPRKSPELLKAVDKLDPQKVAREDKMLTFADSMVDIDWYTDNKDDLDRLFKINPNLRNIALFYLRQSVLGFLSEDMAEPRKTTREVLSRLLRQARRGTESEKIEAKEAMEIIYRIGLEYESHPVYSLLAAAHDPSVYGTARYRLERKMIKVSGSRLAINFVKQIIKLTESGPDQITTHLNSLSRRLSCPSCYGYVGGLSTQMDVLSRGDSIVPTKQISEKDLSFVEEMNKWVRGGSL